ncbi:hypothetical protein A1O1_07664 [Capronia coronata CBS 617.96]|uniref:Major royal jelly protein n=1 Tax=Capronia coronata CBS 617.96 TaxID=1182541 RepID=W9XW73_9EURO|nr:uncharacterized protein A1O1_07664 [Capronia coronata CBS 617.96]EXJ81600.1 hypothetical protein A1O1_07664 [Capronia coronata CBS 617.96]
MKVIAMFWSISLLLQPSLTSTALAAQNPRVQVALTLQHPVNGVSTTPDGRLFVLYARVDGSTGPQVAEWHNGSSPTPYPNQEWNSYAGGKDPATHLVRTNSQRIGPDGTLWLVDTGSPGFGEPVILPDGPKLVQVNLTTDSVTRVYNLGNVTLATILIDDVRFNPAVGLAYITDAGAPALIVLDLDSSQARRVLENDPTNEAFYNSSLASVLAQYPEPYALTPSTGGTDIDAEGNIYNSDTNRQAIIKIAPNGTWTTLVQDSRLLWVDAMWIDTDGKLWMPAAQLNRGTPFNNGSSWIQKPLYVYTIDLGVGPSPIDHA